MPDVTQEMRQAGINRSEQDAAIAQEKEALSNAKANENFRQLDSVYRLPGWKYFFDNDLMPMVDELKEQALDINKTSDQRDTAAKQYAFGIKMLEKLKEQRGYWARQSGIKLAD